MDKAEPEGKDGSDPGAPVEDSSERSTTARQYPAGPAEMGQLDLLHHADLQQPPEGYGL